MSKSDTFENDLLALIFNGTAIADLAENDASSPLTALYLALHTADPTDAGNQTTNEVSYTGYSRKSVNRNSGGFTVSGNQVTLTANNDFGACSAGTATATHWSVGTAPSGAGKILYHGDLVPDIVISNGVTPRMTTGTTITED